MAHDAAREPLTERERDVLRELAAGRTNAEIAETLGITFATAKWHVSSVLAKLGVESRDEAAAWWQRQRSIPGRIRRTLAFPLLPVALALGGAGAVAAGVVLVSVVATALGGSGTTGLPVAAGSPATSVSTSLPSPTASPPPPLATPPVLPETASGEGWRAMRAPGASALDSALITLSGFPVPTLRLFNPATQRWVAALETGYNPMVVVRERAGELLVSDVMIRDGAVEPRLLVFNLRDGLAFVAEAPLPGRVRTHGGPEGMALSGNERYLFYWAVEWQTEPASCATSGDGAVCELRSIVVMDLATLQPVGPKVDLPRGCGATLATAGPESVLITCYVNSYALPAGQVFTLDPSLVLSPVPPPGELPEADPVLSQNPAAVAPVWEENGSRGYLYSEGTYLRIGADGARESARAVPDGKRPAAPPVALPDGRLAIGYATRYYDHVTEGIAIFDPRSLRIDRTVSLPGLRTVRRLPSGALFGLTESGEIVEVDLQQGALRPTGATLGGGDHDLVR